MNSLARAQARWDSMEPDDDSRYEEAASRWVEDKAEQLVRGCDLIIRRPGQVPIVVNYDAFLAKVQDHLNDRQIAGKDDENMFAQVVIAAVSGTPAQGMARLLLGHSGHPEGKLYEMAVELVEPHAEAGLEAQAEDEGL